MNILHKTRWGVGVSQNLTLHIKKGGVAHQKILRWGGGDTLLIWASYVICPSSLMFINCDWSFSIEFLHHNFLPHEHAAFHVCLKEKLFQFWFNTFFVESEADDARTDNRDFSWSIGSQCFDVATKDRGLRNFPPDFRVKIRGGGEGSFSFFIFWFWKIDQVLMNFTGPTLVSRPHSDSTRGVSRRRGCRCHSQTPVSWQWRLFLSEVPSFTARLFVDRWQFRYTLTYFEHILWPTSNTYADLHWTAYSDLHWTAAHNGLVFYSN